MQKSVSWTHRHRVDTGSRNNMQARCSQRIRALTVMPAMASGVVLTSSHVTKNDRTQLQLRGKRHQNCTTRTQYFYLCPYAEECCTAVSKSTSAGAPLVAWCYKMNSIRSTTQKNKAYQIMSITSYLSPKESPI